MARVAVVHNTLDFQGGADVVCLESCRALADEHDVDLLTVSATDPAALAARFDVDADPTVRAPPGSGTLARALSAAAPWTGAAMGARSALVAAWARRVADDYDVLVSTTNELDVPGPSVQYVHYPQFHLDAVGESPGAVGRWLSRYGGPADRDLPADATLLTNSPWTGDVVERIYGRRPTVVYPPVDPIPGRPWDERERGIVVLGRIAPDKRPLAAVRIVDRLRERGRDVHLHVVGSAPPAYRSYVRRVERAAAARPYVTVERDADRARVEDLLGSHRYGLNCKPDEHFGMAVAEFVAAGMVAVAPDSGGQRAVLDGRADRLYDDEDGAVARLDRAIRTDARPELPADRFASERFRAAMRDAVERAPN